jgi:hypothetical protein
MLQKIFKRFQGLQMSVGGPTRQERDMKVILRVPSNSTPSDHPPTEKSQ